MLSTPHRASNYAIVSLYCFVINKNALDKYWDEKIQGTGSRAFWHLPSEKKMKG